jgi:hypothetical protein
MQHGGRTPLRSWVPHEGLNALRMGLCMGRFELFAHVECYCQLALDMLHAN